MRQIGILGGTFDPIHKGHIALALNAKKKFELDEVWMMPSPNPPHKAEKKITDYRLRSKMLKIALQDYPSLQLSEFEIQRQGKIYTYETLQGLNASFTDVEFSFIMGADSLFEIEKWVRPDIVMREARILVNNDLLRSAIAKHFRFHGCTCKYRCSHFQLVVTYRQNLIKCKLFSRLSAKLLHPDYITLGNLVLLATGYNNRVHVRTSFYITRQLRCR